MRSFRNKRLVDALVRTRNRSPKEIETILKAYEGQARPRPKTLKGVRNGNFFRINLPPRPKNVPEVPKIPSPIGPTPKPLQSLPPKVVAEPAASSAGAGTKAATLSRPRLDYFDRIIEFLKLNYPVLIMNAGSFCTLLAFTRTDVLQLRAFSVTGSVCFIAYNFFSPPVKWLTIGWTTLFASVNTYKIIEIVNERHSHVEMTPEMEETYTQYFMPHGITPKQFERIEKSAQRIVVKKNEPLVKQGQHLDHVYLIVEGSTRASVLGRYLTAASTKNTGNPTAEEKEGVGGNCNSGAWVGEMAFLESYWEKEKGNAGNASTTMHYTVVAKEDCVVWRWSHESMEKLLAKSGDIRSALTRAMTSAIVGKVVNFTVSRTSARPTWQTWLDEWKLARNSVTASFSSPVPAAKEEENQGTGDIGRESPA